jgi:hypothetical protein
MVAQETFTVEEINVNSLYTLLIIPLSPERIPATTGVNDVYRSMSAVATLHCLWTE